jgi:tetratricopeptide (TPR) repeat protein
MKKAILVVVILAVVAGLGTFGLRAWRSAGIQRDLSKAQELFEAGEYVEASNLFRSVWERDGGNVKAITGLIESNYYAGRFKDVLAAYLESQGVPDIPPKLITYKAWSELRLSYIHADQRDRWFQDAKASFEQAVAQDSRNPEAFAGRGLVSLQESGLDLSSPMTGFRPIGPYLSSEVAVAKKNFQRALQLKPGHPEASRGLAIVAYSEGDSEEVTRLDRTLSRTEGTDFLLTRALIHLGADPGQAMPIRDAMSGLMVANDPQRALRHCLMGMAEYLLGNLDEAQRNLKTACRNDPGFHFPAIRLHLAKVEETRGNWGAARDALEELRKQRGYRRDPSILFVLALNAYHRNEASEMERLLREVQRGRPDAPDVLLLLASQEPNEIDRRAYYLQILEVDPDNFIARYNLGTIRLRLREDTQASIADFRVSLRARPNFKDARLNLANALRQATLFDEAADEYGRVLDEWPDLDEAKLGLALVLLEQGKREDAVSVLEQVANEGTLGAMAQLLLARGAAGDGDISGALGFAQKAVELDPGSYEARTFLGNLSIERNQPEKAIPHFQEASKNPNHVFYPDAVNGLAVAYYLQEDYGRALNELEQVISRVKEWGNPAPFFVNRGNVYFRQLRYSDAESDYEEGRTADPFSAIAPYNLGVLKETLRDFERARRYYREAVQRQPKFPWAHLNLGNLYATGRERRDAIEQYRRASDDDPELDEAYVNLAIQLIESGEYSEAVEYLERAAERSPGSTVIHNALAIIRLQMDALAEAESECDRSLEADPVNATARLLKGLVRIAQSRFSDAESLLRTVPSTENLDLSYRSSLGITQVRLGNVRAGIESLENAVELARRSIGGKRFLPRALINLSWGLIQVGEYDRALTVLRESTTLEQPEPFSDVEITLKKLEKV